jgi:hypothetical protein
MFEKQNAKRDVVRCFAVRSLVAAAVLAVLISCSGNTFKVTNTQELLTAFEKIQKSKKTGFFITVQGSIFAPPINITTAGYSGKTITINGENGIIQLQLNEMEEPEETCLFVIGKEVTLILESGITLKGIDDNATALVVVDGIFTMNEGSKVTGNTNANGGRIYGAGVRIRGGGEFTLSGGSVSDNKTTGYVGSGGIFVDENAIFTMNSGEISGNSTEHASGGGVFVAVGGLFTMSGGTISGNSTKDGYWESGAYYAMGGGGVNDWGTFTMTGGEISGNTSELGGGVNVHGDSGAVFAKTGGIIYGKDADDDKKNVAHNTGQAVRLSVGSNVVSRQDRFRSNTVGEDVNLSSEDPSTNWRD